MEFYEKLQKLRKQKGLTQEELAEALFVSRTAISKWESGRGYPNIDSLKAISKYFSVSLDELLSSDEALTIAEEYNKRKETHFRDLAFGLLDCSVSMFLFLPFFGQKADGIIQAVPLLSLTAMESYVKIPYLIIVFWLIIWGILILALQNCESALWLRSKYKVSLGASALGALFFMISLQPYAAMFTFIFLAIKALMLIKWV
ncbi:helix-turn-helix domain-containing protein [Pseudoflavonifractor phocaeensis]|uniref:helix-turn-helix domain-containing protein n=1 Tax=Pseudoflavonifractor phocaeensis TaxID=1870988 RepID=UPI001F40246E|nr:helix-turn-helix transcriptional regulator [Pseudoflavonifractor phocaeensis]MCF2596453.1 helix-turn-helix transcriptional regulator [Pseudoflavonifractor phocaeensis]